MASLGFQPARLVWREVGVAAEGLGMRALRGLLPRVLGRPEANNPQIEARENPLVAAEQILQQLESGRSTNLAKIDTVLKLLQEPGLDPVRVAILSSRARTLLSLRFDQIQKLHHSTQPKAAELLDQLSTDQFVTLARKIGFAMETTYLLSPAGRAEVRPVLLEWLEARLSTRQHVSHHSVHHHSSLSPADFYLSEAKGAVAAHLNTPTRNSQAISEAAMLRAALFADVAALRSELEGGTTLEAVRTSRGQYEVTLGKPAVRAA